MTQTTTVKVENFTDEELDTMIRLFRKGGVHLPDAPAVIDVPPSKEPTE